MTYILPSYPATIWNACKTGLAFTAAQLAANTPETQKAVVLAMGDSLGFGLNAIECDLFYVAAQQIFDDLSPVPSLDLTLSAGDQAFLIARVNAIQAAVISIQTASELPVPALLVRPVANIAQALVTGTPIFTDPGYLEWLLTFAFETPPSGLTTGNFLAQAQAEAAAWTAIATAMQTQGVSFTGNTLNTVVQMGQCAQVVANAIENLSPVSAALGLPLMWNQLVTVPTLTRLASLVYNDPTSLPSQNTAAVRYTMILLTNQYNALAITLRQATVQNVKLATVQQGDSLMDIAARELGNYEQWYQIAQVNGLVPPFIGPQPLPGIATQGQQLFMPVNGSTANLGSAPNYQINYLGVDVWYGPINQDMTTWTGDFNVIAGYQNLSFSLGRRLQTTLGDLIYHIDFGSRVPPEIGNIASSEESSHVQAYTQSALLSDPRVNKIVAISVATQPNSAIVVNSTVLPNGIGTATTTVNVVLGPA